MRPPEVDAPAYGYGWSFVALEYWALVLNRIYLVYVGDRMLSGACMGGPVMALPYPRAAWEQEWWLSDRQLRRYAGVDVQGPEFRGRHWANFQLPRAEIADVWFDASPKWGMGTVPYSGRIHVAWRDGHRRELILLGRQDGPAIRDRLLPAHARTSVGAADAVPRPTWTLPRPGIIVPEG
jgi:hypothetical protein